MAFYKGVEGLANCINDYYKKALAAAENSQKVQAGRISGGNVIINGKYYTYTLATDVNIFEGAYVYCLINNNIAVIVGGC